MSDLAKSYLELSITHLPQSDVDILESGKIEDLNGGPSPLGFFVPVPSFQYEQVANDAQAKSGLSPAIKNIWDYARGNGISLLWFDVDHEVVSELEEFDQ